MKRRTRRTGTRLAAVAAVLGTVLGAAVGAPALATAAPADGSADGPATYRTADDATPVEGTASSSDGPELKPGIYTDSIGRGEEKFYSVELDEVSTVYLSAVAAPEPGTKVASFGEGLEMKLTTTSGEQCDTAGRATFSGDDQAYPIGDYAARRIGGDIERCQQAGPYLFSVKREGPGTSDPGDWPLEIRFMAEPGLEGTAPGPPGKDTWSTELPTPPTGTSQRAKGGTSFNDAGAVGSGVWKDTVRAGETIFYRVPLDWGQQLAAFAELPNAAKKSESPEFVSRALGFHLFNPARADVVDNNFESYRGEQTSAGLITRPVEYGNRFDDDGRGISTAGWYYLAVTLHPGLAEHFPDGATVTLRVKVSGEAAEGPGYDGDAAAAGFGVTDKDKEAAEKGLSAADVTQSDGWRLVAWGGIGAGTVLVLGLGLWMLLARLRHGRRGAPSDAAAQQHASTGTPQGGVPGGYAAPGPYGGGYGYPGPSGPPGFGGQQQPGHGGSAPDGRQ
ncbi:hypothetical protein QNO07_07525 [Streptomyces sp. 549]|uniref:hypothetical protein n=1 Tax=Streptomyces sp. 549 TaxID=3049076 RepID=UPI0024C304F4|nr:hypothetical protein [Streptomyces sp. 549]MDK1473272.1 hypothetical protein [Streptomyces sp. 549]